MRTSARQSGFGAIVAIMVLVILAALAAAMTRMSATQHLTSAQDIQAAKAWQAAKAGTEWGLFQALQPTGTWQACTNSSAALDLTADTGFWVTVSCDSFPYNEGEISSSGVQTAQTVRVYRINAVACNAAGGCLNNAQATAPGYVERMRQVVATN